MQREQIEMKRIIVESRTEASKGKDWDRYSWHQGRPYDSPTRATWCVAPKVLENDDSLDYQQLRDYSQSLPTWNTAEDGRLGTIVIHFGFRDLAIFSVQHAKAKTLWHLCAEGRYSRMMSGRVQDCAI